MEESDSSAGSYDDLTLVLQLLVNALDGKPVTVLPPHLAQRAELQLLQERGDLLQRFVLALSRGDLSQSLDLKGPFAGSLKTLQASLRHLTWQAKRVAQRDYSQRVDFMGDFSEAFNTMVERLEEKQKQVEENEQQLTEMNNNLMAEIEERKRLESQERQAKEKAEKLRQAALQLGKSLEFEEVLDMILVQVEQIVPYDGANILFLEGDRAVIRKHRGYERFGKNAVKIMDQLALSIDSSPMYQSTIITKQPVVISDTFNDPRWKRFQLDMNPVRSWCGFPLIVHGEVIGFMGLDKLEPGFYQDEHIEYLQIFASQAALALGNAYLFEEMRQMAGKDPLTGVSNRRAFFERAQEEHRRACRYKTTFSILMLDIDYFKRVNDRYGHTAGDQVLQHIARLCAQSLREIDRFGRYGGEEFIALLPQTGHEAALVTAERLRSLVEQAVIPVEAGEIRCTVSVGMATFLGDCESLEGLLERADQALYRAKRAGRNRVEI